MWDRFALKGVQDRKQDKTRQNEPSWVERRRDGARTGPDVSQERKLPMEKKSIHGWNSTRVWPSDRLTSRSPWQRKMGREEATEIERHGVERERKIEHRLESIVERGHRVRRDDLLSSLRLLAGIVNIAYTVVLLAGTPCTYLQGATHHLDCTFSFIPPCHCFGYRVGKVSGVGDDILSLIA